MSQKRIVAPAAKFNSKICLSPRKKIFGLDFWDGSLTWKDLTPWKMIGRDLALGVAWYFWGKPDF